MSGTGWCPEPGSACWTWLLARLSVVLLWRQASMLGQAWMLVQVQVAVQAQACQASMLGQAWMRVQVLVAVQAQVLIQVWVVIQVEVEVEVEVLRLLVKAPVGACWGRGRAAAAMEPPPMRPPS